MFATLDKVLLFEHIQEVRPTIEGRPVEAFADEFAALPSADGRG